MGHNKVKKGLCPTCTEKAVHHPDAIGEENETVEASVPLGDEAEYTPLYRPYGLHTIDEDGDGEEDESKDKDENEADDLRWSIRAVITSPNDSSPTGEEGDTSNDASDTDSVQDDTQPLERHESHDVFEEDVLAQAQPAADEKIFSESLQRLRDCFARKFPLPSPGPVIPERQASLRAPITLDPRTVVRQQFVPRKYRRRVQFALHANEVMGVGGPGHDVPTACMVALPRSANPRRREGDVQGEHGHHRPALTPASHQRIAFTRPFQLCACQEWAKVDLRLHHAPNEMLFRGVGRGGAYSRWPEMRERADCDECERAQQHVQWWINCTPLAREFLDPSEGPGR